MPHVFPRILLALFLISICAPARAQNPSVGEAEAQRCEEKIASVQRDVLGRYEDALLELQNGFQKAADLEGALAVRAERQRLTAEGRLADANLVADPKSVRALQVQTIARLKDLTAQLVQESVPRLLELKRSLTVAGKLDEAVGVRAAIERLQNGYVPLTRPEAGTVVAAEALWQSYSADRSRADKTFKGQKIIVRGVFGGLRADPNDAKIIQVYLAGGPGGWVLGNFSGADFRFREDTQFGNPVSILVPKADEAAAVRWQKGQTVEMRGVCDGLDGVVRLTRCELVK